LKDEKKENNIKKIQKKSTPKQSVKRNAKETINESPKITPHTSKKTISNNLSKTPKEIKNDHLVKPLQTPPVRNKKVVLQQQTSVPETAGKNKTPASNYKRSKSKHRVSGFVKILSVFVVFLLIASITVLNFGGITFSNVSDGIKSLFSTFSPGKGFPYQISSAELDTIEMLGSSLLISADGLTKVINSTAGETLSFQDTLTNHLADVCNGRAIIFDRASSGFKVLSRTGVLFEKDAGQNILVAAMGKKGNFAVATESKTAQSEVTVYNSNKNPVFTWKCADERISAVALSDDGKNIAVSVVGAKGGEIYSKLNIFAFNKNKTLANFNYPGSALIKVRFTGKTTVIALGDKLMSVVNFETKQKNDISFGTSELHRLDMNERGKTALVLAPFGNTAQSELKVYSSTGGLLFEKKMNEEVIWVTCDESYTSVLQAKKVQSFNNKGELMGNIKLSNEAEKILISGKKTYIVGGSRIIQYATVGKEQ